MSIITPQTTSDTDLGFFSKVRDLNIRMWAQTYLLNIILSWWRSRNGSHSYFVPARNGHSGSKCNCRLKCIFISRPIGPARWYCVSGGFWHLAKARLLNIFKMQDGHLSNCSHQNESFYFWWLHYQYFLPSPLASI